MFNFDYITKEHISEHNPNWPEFPARMSSTYLNITDYTHMLMTF